MAWVFPVFLLAWPVVEIVIFIKVAAWLGWPGAILGIVVSGMAGSALLRHQGLSTARLAESQMRGGAMPVGGLFDSACLAVAGILLLIPGFVTDLLALPLLVPPVRHLLQKTLASRLTVHQPPSPPPPPDRGRSGTVIEGEWTVIDDDKPNGSPDAP